MTQALHSMVKLSEERYDKLYTVWCTWDDFYVMGPIFLVGERGDGFISPGGKLGGDGPFSLFPGFTHVGPSMAPFVVLTRGLFGGEVFTPGSRIKGGDSRFSRKRKGGRQPLCVECAAATGADEEVCWSPPK